MSYADTGLTQLRLRFFCDLSEHAVGTSIVFSLRLTPVLVGAVAVTGLFATGLFAIKLAVSVGPLLPLLSSFSFETSLPSSTSKLSCIASAADLSLPSATVFTWSCKVQDPMVKVSSAAPHEREQHAAEGIGEAEPVPWSHGHQLD